LFSCHANQHNDEYRNGDRSRLPIGKEILGAIEDRGIICPYKLVVNAQCGLVMGITGACAVASDLPVPRSYGYLDLSGKRESCHSNPEAKKEICEAAMEAGPSLPSAPSAIALDRAIRSDHTPRSWLIPLNRCPTFPIPLGLLKRGVPRKLKNKKEIYYE